MAIHDGHRERLRDCFLEHGLDSFHEVQALELLLFYAIPRRDTNPVAHALLDHFGSLDAVFAASERELCDVPGVGKSTAALILLVPQIFKRSRVAAASEKRYIRNGREEAEYLFCGSRKRSAVAAESYLEARLRAETDLARKLRDSFASAFPD